MCTKQQRKLCGDEMNVLFVSARSFASHEKAKFWSDMNQISPLTVAKNSNVTYKFKCDCGHIFESKPGRINGGSWCPFCMKCGDRTVWWYQLYIMSSKIICFYMKKSKFWDPSNKDQPRNVCSKQTKKKNINFYAYVAIHFWNECAAGFPRTLVPILCAFTLVQWWTLYHVSQSDLLRLKVWQNIGPQKIISIAQEMYFAGQ